MSDGLRCHVRHIRSADLCMTGARIYFQQQGWSWADFLKNGRLVSDVEAVGDPLGMKVVEEARKEQENG